MEDKIEEETEHLQPDCDDDNDDRGDEEEYEGEEEVEDEPSEEAKEESSEKITDVRSDLAKNFEIRRMSNTEEGNKVGSPRFFTSYLKSEYNSFKVNPTKSEYPDLRPDFLPLRGLNLCHA